MWIGGVINEWTGEVRATLMRKKEEPGYFCCPFLLFLSLIKYYNHIKWQKGGENFSEKYITCLNTINTGNDLHTHQEGDTDMHTGRVIHLS